MNTVEDYTLQRNDFIANKWNVMFIMVKSAEIIETFSGIN